MLKRNILALGLGSLFAVILLEIMVRAFPQNFTLYLRFCDVAYKKGTAEGHLPMPDQKAMACRECYRIYPVLTNSLGFRDKEWFKNDSFKIGVLGDSAIIAQEVAEGEHISAVLEDILRKEVLNAGSGGIGTITELEIYKKYLRPLKPNLVILFFTKSNDVHDNSCALTKMLGYERLQLCGYISNGEIKINTALEHPDEQVDQSPSRIKRFLKKYCLSCLVINRFRFRKMYGFLYKDALNKRNICYWDVYRAKQTEAWRDAWNITEKTLADLKNEVERDGARLVIVALPDFINYSPDWKKDLVTKGGLSEIPSDFDLTYPAQRLMQICLKYGIPLLNIDEYLVMYRDKFRLKFPYFSYWCDRHYNPLGHFLISNFTARFLVKNNFVALGEEEKTRLLQKIEQNLALSPLEALGKEAHAQIYGRRQYRGSSNISKILQDNQ